MQKWIEQHQWQAALTACIIALLFLGVFIGMSVPVAAASQTSYCGASIRDQQRTVLPGHVVPALKGVSPLHALNCKTAMTLSITLQPRNMVSLTTFLKAVNDPKSPQYHKYLSTQAYAQQYGQTTATIDQLSAYLRSAGFTILEVGSNRLSIRVSATAATIERAFALHLGVFDYKGAQVYAPLENPSILSAYAPAIQAITGLSDLPVSFVPRQG
jgi:subtilase family serine protease